MENKKILQLMKRQTFFIVFRRILQLSFPLFKLLMHKKCLLKHFWYTYSYNINKITI